MLLAAKTVGLRKQHLRRLLSPPPMMRKRTAAGSLAAVGHPARTLLVASLLVSSAASFSTTMSTTTTTQGFPRWGAPTRCGAVGAGTPSSATALGAKKAGTFFNPVPEDDANGGNDDQKDVASDSASSSDDITSGDPFEQNLSEVLKRRRRPSRASMPSTINGIPTSQASRGFGTSAGKAGGSISKGKKKGSGAGGKPFVSVGQRLNDVTKPEYDDQGYTLYADEETGEKSRVFEALVEYPCDFTLKIVGANEGSFVAEMVAIVAESCEVEASDIEHSVRLNGKWTSVTVQAPVKSAEMLYALYENVDRDPRVKFKF